MVLVLRAMLLDCTSFVPVERFMSSYPSLLRTVPAGTSTVNVDMHTDMNVNGDDDHTSEDELPVLYLQACHRFHAWEEALRFFRTPRSTLLPPIAEQLVVETLQRAPTRDGWRLGLRLSLTLHAASDDGMDPATSEPRGVQADVKGGEGETLEDGTVVYPARYAPYPQRCQQHRDLLTSLLRCAGGAHPTTAWSLSLTILASVLRVGVLGSRAQPPPSAYDVCVRQCMRAGEFEHAAHVFDYALCVADVPLKSSTLRMALEALEEVGNWSLSLAAYHRLLLLTSTSTAPPATVGTTRSADTTTLLVDPASVPARVGADDAARSDPEQAAVLDMLVHEQVVRTLAVSGQWVRAATLLGYLLRDAVGVGATIAGPHLFDASTTTTSRVHHRVQLPRLYPKSARMETLRYLLPLVLAARMRCMHPRAGLHKLQAAMDGGVLPHAAPFAAVMEQANRHAAHPLVLTARKLMSRWSVRPCVRCRAQHIIALVRLRSPLQAIRAYMYVKDEGLTEQLGDDAVDALIEAGASLPRTDPFRDAFLDDLRFHSAYARALLQGSGGGACSTSATTTSTTPDDAAAAAAAARTQPPVSDPFDDEVRFQTRYPTRDETTQEDTAKLVDDALLHLVAQQQKGKKEKQKKKGKARSSASSGSSRFRILDIPD